MSTQYALPCTACKRQLRVQASQAGTTLKCKCGKSVDVPSMRGIRRLEPVAETAAKKRRAAADGRWGGRQAAILVCLIVGVPVIGYAVFLIVAPPKDPTVVAEEWLAPKLEYIESEGKSLSLDQSFKWWAEIQDDGINIRMPVPQQLTAAREASRIHRFRLWLSLAIGCLALAVAGTLAFMPSRRLNV